MSISARQQVANNLADTCMFGGLDDSYGVSVQKGTAKSGRDYWGITFAKAAMLDGIIEVYSPSFIVVAWQTAYRDMAAKGREVFKSEQGAKAFLIKNFVRM